MSIIDASSRKVSNSFQTAGGAAMARPNSKKRMAPVEVHRFRKFVTNIHKARKLMERRLLSPRTRKKLEEAGVMPVIAQSVSDSTAAIRAVDETLTTLRGYLDDTYRARDVRRVFSKNAP
jgi:hypothetical protein